VISVEDRLRNRTGRFHSRCTSAHELGLLHPPCREVGPKQSLLLRVWPKQTYLPGGGGSLAVKHRCRFCRSSSSAHLKHSLCDRLQSFRKLRQLRSTLPAAPMSHVRRARRIGSGRLAVRIYVCLWLPRCGGAYMYVVRWCTLCTRGAAASAPYPESNIGLPPAPPATGGSPPVAGPFCARANEFPPARSEATIARLFRKFMIILQNA
jgi:hypothetical protein